MSSQDILHAYRQVYRKSLQAVQYSSPARHTLRTVIRHTFRTRAANEYNVRKLNNTLNFLHLAAQDRGLEHRLVKSLLHVWWYVIDSKKSKPECVSRRKQSHPDGLLMGGSHKALREKERVIRKSAFYHFGVTLAMLNESMATCLPTLPFEQRDGFKIE